MSLPVATTIFLTGATGYIGGRLGPRLLERGYRVRCLTRSRGKLLARPWAADPRVEAVEIALGDAAAASSAAAGAASEGQRPGPREVEALAAAMRGCAAAYYLIHSMNAGSVGFRRRDLDLAEAFGEAAARAGVPRIIYLGGLGETGAGLSEHLASRREVERALAIGGVPVTVLRAAMIIGSGSASFEILRYLVERLPIMITPRWVHTESQPIAVRDVLFYLIAALENPQTTGRAIDIGGPDIWSYERMMREMAKALGLRRRWVIPVPVLTPRLSSLWIHLVTPLHASIARPLAEGLQNRLVCRNDEAQRLMPHRCLGIREAMDAALARLGAESVETRWSDAGVMPGDPVWAGGTTFVDRRSIVARTTPDAAWQAVCALGGDHGYHAANWLWRLRGRMDRLVGGPGLRRGRRHPSELRFGDALDFWRVVVCEPPSRLILRAEMRLPGVATLSFEIEPGAQNESKPDPQAESKPGPRAESSPGPGEDGRVTIVMTARFRPRGLFGILYWYSVLPLHGLVFQGMLKGVARDAARRAEADVAKRNSPKGGA